MIDHVVVNRELMRDTLDVSVQRGAGSGISDHYLLPQFIHTVKFCFSIHSTGELFKFMH